MAIIVFILGLLAWSNQTILPLRDNAVKDTTISPISTHTISPHVKLVDQAFPVLDTTTSIWIYLPDTTSKLKTTYPVIYFLGADNAISDSLSYQQQEWKIDEALDSLYQLKVQKSIVVFINNFISDTAQIENAAIVLKDQIRPYIDSLYPTNRSLNVILGSELNATLSLYTTLMYPLQFHKAGVFSPQNDIAPFVQSRSLNGKGYKGMIFFYEGKDMEDMHDYTDQLAANSSSIIYITHFQNPKRITSPMGGWFPEFYRWIMGNGFNYIIPHQR